MQDVKWSIIAQYVAVMLDKLEIHSEDVMICHHHRHQETFPLSLVYRHRADQIHSVALSVNKLHVNVSKDILAHHPIVDQNVLSTLIVQQRRPALINVV